MTMVRKIPHLVVGHLPAVEQEVVELQAEVLHLKIAPTQQFTIALIIVVSLIHITMRILMET